MHQPCFLQYLLLILVPLLLSASAYDRSGEFTFDGFSGNDLITMDAAASITNDPLSLTSGQKELRGHLTEREVGCVSLADGGAEARGTRAASGESHPSLERGERGERVALQLDRTAVPPFPADGAHVPLQHQHLEPLPPGGEREGQAADAAAGHQDARLGLHQDEPRAGRRKAGPTPQSRPWPWRGRGVKRGENTERSIAAGDGVELARRARVGGTRGGHRDRLWRCGPPCAEHGGGAVGLAAAQRPRLGTTGAVGHGSGGDSAGVVGRGGSGARGGGAVAEARRARWLAAAQWRSARGTCSGRERRESCGRVGDLGF
jgi:hypothetical protein